MARYRLCKIHCDICKETWEAVTMMDYDFSEEIWDEERIDCPNCKTDEGVYIGESLKELDEEEIHEYMRVK